VSLTEILSSVSRLPPEVTCHRANMFLTNVIALSFQSISNIMTCIILIATDGSKYSEMAIDYGVNLAKKMGARVHGLYVVNLKLLEIYSLGHHDDIRGYELANFRIADEGSNALKYIESACAREAVEVETEVKRGYPAAEIMALADRINAEMIVVGNLGRTGIDHLLMGSVSGEIVKKSCCPVLVVRYGPKT
jgi:nucleotide-binding universal stress UspA family protein